jgi:hypothetical protein
LTSIRAFFYGHLTSMCAGYWAFPVVSLGPAVISRIGSKPGDYYEAIVLAAVRCPLTFTAVAALSVACPASVQAVPTTYQYTGNPFTAVIAPYTTSEFVTVMMTLAAPVAPNKPLTTISPIAFTFSDGVQTITNLTPNVTSIFQVVTGPAGTITGWFVGMQVARGFIRTRTFPVPGIHDQGAAETGFGANFASPCTWTTVGAVADMGSTLSLMTLTLMALGVAARQFKRAAA